MYIPYRKAYLTGMNPLSFVTFFSFGELGMMTLLSVSSLGLAPLWQDLLSARSVIFWLMLGGFVWVIGDIFQQFAAKYVGISRGIPLSNSNQLWGLLWGIFVFGELHGRSSSIYLEVIGGSFLMMLGVGAIAFSSATGQEQTHWKEAAIRESDRYGVAADFVEALMDGRQLLTEAKPSREAPDWLVGVLCTCLVACFAAMGTVPHICAHVTLARLGTTAPPRFIARNLRASASKRIFSRRLAVRASKLSSWSTTPASALSFGNAMTA